MQTFGEWLDARLAEREWTAADLTRASQSPQRPRGFDSGLISRWRRPPPHNAVPRNRQTLREIAQALKVPESDVYTAAGLLPPDVRPSPEDEPGDLTDQTIRMLMQRYASVVFSYPRSMWAAVIEANIQMNEAFKLLAPAPDSLPPLSDAADAAGTNNSASQVSINSPDESPNRGSESPNDGLVSPHRVAPSLVVMS